MPRAYELTDKDGNPYDPPRWRATRRINGRRYRVIRRSQQEAIQALFELIAREKAGDVIRRNKSLTIDDWMKDYQRMITTGDGAIAPTTADTYRHLIEKMLDEDYGLTGTSLSAITADKIMEFRGKLASVPTGRGMRRAILGTSRRKAIEIRLNAALDAAVEMGKIARNPWPKQFDRNTNRRRNRQTQQEDEARQEKEAIAGRIDYYPQMIYYHLLSAFNDLAGELRAKPDDKALLRRAEWAHTRLTMYLLSFYGVRPAEARGITLDKVSIDKRTLTISQQLVKQDGKGRPVLTDTTKTAAGKRTIPLSGPILSRLAQQMDIQTQAYQEGRRTALDGKQLLLTSITGKPIPQTEHNRDWNKLLDEGIGQSPLWAERLRLYANRHIAATILQRADFEYEAIARVCGWNTAQGNLLDTYGHWQDDARVQQAIDTIGNAILGHDPKDYTQPVTDSHGQPITINGWTFTQAEQAALQETLGNDLADYIDDNPPPDDDRLYRA